MENEKKLPNAVPASPTTYSVNLWGSNPEDDDNDDCWTGADYATLAEAQAAAADLKAAGFCSIESTLYIEIDGPDHYSVRKASDFERLARRLTREAAQDNAECRRERAMQAGMAFGCDGYNDEMGF